MFTLGNSILPHAPILGNLAALRSKHIQVAPTTGQASALLNLQT